ncbi:MAG: hypothetical protein WC455_23165 [Dehalococcoidia bacterium]|jgi:hypothetical protein
MAEKIPLVLNGGGVEQLQSTDTFAVGASNILINGGFDFFQRQVPGTLTSRADDTYGPDRWVVLTQTAAVQVAQIGGTEAPCAGQLKQNQASAQRMGLAQIVEYSNSMPMRGRNIIFQGKLNCSSEQAIRYAVVEWTDTADTVTSDIVDDWTDTTYESGNFFIAGLNIVAVGSVTPAAVGYTTFSITGSVSAACNNLIVFIWTEGTAAQDVTLSVSSAGLYPGTILQSWNPRPIGLELFLCQRYYEKSYNVATAPGTALGPGPSIRIIINANTAYYGEKYYLVPKRVSTTPTIYSLYSGNSGVIAEYNPSVVWVADRDVIVSGPSQIGWGNLACAGLTANNTMRYHWACDAEL